MKKIGRNDPCPCGSGKKYKQCCLGKDNEAHRQEQHRRQAMELALGWLIERHGSQVEDETLEHFFASRPYFDHVDDVPGPVRHAVEANCLEWILAEAWITVGEKRRSALSLALDELGPQLADEQRQWLEMMGRHAVGLYQVREIRPGSEIWLDDLIDPERPPLKLLDPILAKDVEVTMMIGARLLPMGDHWLRTSAVYPFTMSRVDDLKENVHELRQDLAGDAEVDEAERPWAFGSLVIAHWLAQAYDGVVDPEDFVPNLEVSHYRVNDWERLAAVLAAQDDVEGGRTGGWTRHYDDEEDVDDDGVWRMALNPAADDRLDVVSQFADDADEDREWLAGAAGEALTFLDSEELDPVGEDILLDEDYWNLPPAEKTVRMQAIVEEDYRDWASKPLPHLAGKPPLLAARTDEGRAEVVELLKRYEEGEREFASREEREPVSYRFLWEAVGLDREAELRLRS